LLEVLSGALEAAHVAGIVHRDLTPGNILFSSASPSPGDAGLDEGVPKISDFGLAKSFGPQALSSSDARTMTGDLLGTPAYMSPEQAAGRPGELGPATDIYALGAILYEMLTGHPPFRGVTAVETLQLVLGSEPVPPSRLRPGISRDLETICLKCLQKQPSRRYARALDLSEDLRRFLAGEPIVARPVGRISKIARWCRRKPLLASLVAMVATLCLVVVAGSMAAAVRLNQSARDRLAETRLAEARVHRLGRQLGRGERSLAALAEAARIRATPEVRDEALASLAQFDVKFARYGPTIAPGRAFMAFDPQLARYASGDAAGALFIHEAATEREICRIARPESISGVLFSPQGRYVACRLAGRYTVEIWFVGTAEPRLAVTELCDLRWGIGAVNFSSDGNLAAVGRPDGLVRVYDLKTGTQLSEMRAAGKISHLAFHPLRPQLAIATSECVEIRNCQNGRLLIQLDEAAESEFLAWHPQGTMLAASDREMGISLWEPDRLRRRGVLTGHAAGGLELGFNHSGTLLVSHSWDGSLRVWDPHWGKPLFETIGSNAYYLWFSADDRFWAGDVVDGQIRIWELPSEPAYRRLTPESKFDLGHFRTAAISPAHAARGRLLAVAMQHGVGFWDLRTGRPAGHLAIGEATDIAFDSAGNLFTADATETRFWAVRESAGAAGELRIGPPERVASVGTLSQLASSANGRLVGFSRLNSGGLILDRDRPDALVSLSPHADVRSIALTPDGTMAATGSHNRSLVKIWNTRTGEALHELNLPSSRVAFSPDGRKLLTTARGLELWSVGDWRRLWKGDGSSLSAHAFSPDGRLVAVDAGTGRIMIYAADDGRIIAQLDDPYPAALHSLAIGPDGRYLVGISRDLYHLFVWDLAGASRRLAEIGAVSELFPAGAPEVDKAAALSLAIDPGDADQQLLDELARSRSALADRPADGELLLRTGRLLCRLGRDDEARPVFSAAITAALPAASIELAACEMRGERWEAALEVLDRALSQPALAPALSASLCNTLAWFLSLAPAELRDPQKALALARRAIELDPGNRKHLAVLGLAFYRLGEHSLAVETLKLSLRDSNSPVFDLYVLALCQRAMRDAGSAADYTSRAEYLRETHSAEWSVPQRAELQRIREEVDETLKERAD
jgi:WD40 repeat protein/Tfp pilus assembly protein PilF